MASLNFDSNNVAPDTGFDPIPAGDYTAVIIDSDMKTTKNGAGQYLALTLQIIDGPYANRMLWDRLTLVHDNAKTVEIAQRRLSAICHAVGVLAVQDSTQLHNRPMVVRLKYVEDPQYGPKNEIGSYKATQGQAPAAQRPSAQAPAAMPWQGQAPAAQPQPQASAPTAQAPAWTPPQAQAPAAASVPPWARAG